MARCCCDDGDGANHGQNNEDGGHDDRSGKRAGRVVKDLNDGDASGRLEDIIDIADAKAEGYDHCEPQQSVEEGRPDHGGWEDPTGILQFLRHVRAGIRAQKAPKRRRYPNEARQANIAPSTSVREGSKDLTCRCMVTHGPQDDQEGEIPEDVDNQEDTLSQGQFSSQEDIKGHGNDQEEHNEEGCLPKGSDIRVFILEQYQALDECGSELGRRRTTSDPSEESQPADNIA